MMSTGFSWGTQNLSESADVSRHNNKISIPRYTPTVNSSQVDCENHTARDSSHPRKRKLHDGDDSKIHKPVPASTRKYYSNLSSAKHKKSRTPRIVGQHLPINRLIEVLDHKSLQKLLHDLIILHPETSNTIQKLSPKPSMKNSIDLIKEKFDNIKNHLPYKCDVESDYSYLRVKSHINEFLNCLSDFILNLLPPIETNISNSIQFLDVITNLIHNLPNFTNHEFRYTRSMAYEQIANTWLIVLGQRIQHFGQEDTANGGASSNYADSLDSTPPASSSNSSANLESSVELIKVIEESNLEQRLEKHNEVSMGKFKLVIEFVKSEINNYEQLKQSLHAGPSSSILNELITVDYSNFSIAARTSH